MNPLIHSNKIRKEHKLYIDNFERLITERLKNARKKLSFEYYKMSYSTFVLVDKLIKKRQGTIYLKELRAEIVFLIGLGTLGFETSLHLRRCIELFLKHVYYAHHPIEFQILSESVESGEFSKEEKNVAELFDYLRFNPNFKNSKKLKDPINSLHARYKELCEIVHARKISIPSKLEDCTIPKLKNSDIQQGKNIYRQTMRDITVLLIMFHNSSVVKFNEYEKEAILYSLTPSFKPILRTTLGI